MSNEIYSRVQQASLANTGGEAPVLVTRVFGKLIGAGAVAGLGAILHAGHDNYEASIKRTHRAKQERRGRQRIGRKLKEHGKR